MARRGNFIKFLKGSAFMWHDLWGWGLKNVGAAARPGKTRRLARSARRCFLESLEERKVLATLVLDAGTAGDDLIEINGVGSNVTVKLNGNEIYNVSTAGYDAVQINAADGADIINLDGVPTSPGGSSVVAEAEPNDSTGAAQDLEAAGWISSTADGNVDDGLGNPIVEPHVTVNATFDASPDYYSFTVTSNSLVRVDIDLVSSITAFDSYVQIVDGSDTTVIDLDNVLAESDGIFPEDSGSAPGTSDAFVVANLAPGTYYIRVSEFPSSPFVPGTTYQMHVSASGHSVSSGGSMATVAINGGDGSDTLNVAAGLMPSSAIAYILNVGNQPFSGELSHDGSPIVAYTSVETFNGGGAFTVLTDVAPIAGGDSNPDTTWVRGNLDGTKLLVDVNGATYFTGGLNQILIAAVNGSSDADIILVENIAANAHIDGGGGNDTITTGDGFDIVYGGEGDDTIFGGDGDDTLFGNGGNDVLSGQGGNDVVSGGTGDDQVSGQTGQDVLIGGTGLDQVLGNSDRDLLFASGVVLDENDISEDFEPLQQLLTDWLTVVAALMDISVFRTKYVSGIDDGVEDKLQGGNGDDLFYLDGSARIIDSAGDRDPLT
jgi:Ca2+-binding RTX toxin-like protein